MNASTQKRGMLVKEYFMQHQEELSFEKQFHFHSRLWLWEGNTESETWLRQHMTTYIGSSPEETSKKINSLIQNTNNLFRHKEKYDGIRILPLEKYPHIMGYVKALAVCLHTKNIYGITISIPTAHDLIMGEYYTMLTQNPRDLAILSTIGVNFLYMYRIIVKKGMNSELILPEYMLKITSEQYKNNNHNELLLQLYLITHSIIGETNFYRKPIENYHTIYKEMAIYAEKKIKENYSSITLDIKFEFLVCCILCKHDTFLQDQIHAESEISFSHLGKFLVDSLSKKNQDNIPASEHRNVLFIMSTLKYNPPIHTLNSSFS